MSNKLNIKLSSISKKLLAMALLIFAVGQLTPPLLPGEIALISILLLVALFTWLTGLSLFDIIKNHVKEVVAVHVAIWSNVEEVD